MGEPVQYVDGGNRLPRLSSRQCRDPDAVEEVRLLDSFNDRLFRPARDGAGYLRDLRCNVKHNRRDLEIGPHSC